MRALPFPMVLGGGLKKNSKQKQYTRNAGWKRETKPEQETKGDAEESTEMRRVPQRRVPRRRERVKPTRRK